MLLNNKRHIAWCLLLFVVLVGCSQNRVGVACHEALQVHRVMWMLARLRLVEKKGEGMYWPFLVLASRSLVDDTKVVPFYHNQDNDDYFVAVEDGDRDLVDNSHRIFGQSRKGRDHVHSDRSDHGRNEEVREDNRDHVDSKGHSRDHDNKDRDTDHGVEGGNKGRVDLVENKVMLSSHPNMCRE